MFNAKQRIRKGLKTIWSVTNSNVDRQMQQLATTSKLDSNSVRTPLSHRFYGVIG